MNDRSNVVTPVTRIDAPITLTRTVVKGPAVRSNIRAGQVIPLAPGASQVTPVLPRVSQVSPL